MPRGIETRSPRHAEYFAAYLPHLAWGVRAPEYADLPPDARYALEDRAAELAATVLRRNPWISETPAAAWPHASPFRALESKSPRHAQYLAARLRYLAGERLDPTLQYPNLPLDDRHALHDRAETIVAAIARRKLGIKPEAA